MSWQDCADTLLVSRTTLWRRALELGITTMSEISDLELDSVVERIVHEAPNCGTIMVWGQLKSLGINVPRRRVCESLLRVNPSVVESRQRTCIIRRSYNVASSNALWHIDGQHSLVRWKVVVHGGIDGYSRKIVDLHASGNNRADTVMKLFTKAVQSNGWPSRVRSDMGGENVEVARAMIMARGLSCSSHIAGSSVINQRIERLWRDTFRCVLHIYYSVFYEMEESGLLCPTNEVHLFCLHYVFLPRINFQLERFMGSWNNHRLRTEHGLTPEQLWTRGLCFADQLIFDQPSTGEDYGVEYNQQIPDPFDAGYLIIPEIELNLSDVQLEELQESCSPLCASEYHGLDIYLMVLETVLELL